MSPYAYSGYLYQLKIGLDDGATYTATVGLK